MAVQRHYNRGSTGPIEYAKTCALVTPSDAADLTFVSRAISFGTAGALRITTEAGDDVTIPSGALAAGVLHPIGASRIWATGTTAASIVIWGEKNE